MLLLAPPKPQGGVLAEVLLGQPVALAQRRVGHLHGEAALRVLLLGQVRGRAAARALGGGNRGRGIGPDGVHEKSKNFCFKKRQP